MVSDDHLYFLLMFMTTTKETFSEQEQFWWLLTSRASRPSLPVEFSSSWCCFSPSRPSLFPGSLVIFNLFLGLICVPLFWICITCSLHREHPSSDLFATGRRKLKAFKMFGTLVERLMSGWYFEKLESVWLLWLADGLGNPRYCFGSVLPWQSESTGLRL